MDYDGNVGNAHVDEDLRRAGSWRLIRRGPFLLDLHTCIADRCVCCTRRWHAGVDSTPQPQLATQLLKMGRSLRQHSTQRSKFWSTPTMRTPPGLRRSRTLKQRITGEEGKKDDVEFDAQPNSAKLAFGMIGKKSKIGFAAQQGNWRANSRPGWQEG